MLSSKCFKIGFIRTGTGLLAVIDGCGAAHKVGAESTQFQRSG